MMDFKCQQCGECCRVKDGIVRVGDADIAAMSAVLGMREDTFIDRCCDLAPDRHGLVLKNAGDGRSCIMLEMNRCKVCSARPKKCRTFPCDWMNDNSAEYCPGLDHHSQSTF